LGFAKVDSGVIDVEVGFRRILAFTGNRMQIQASVLKKRLFRLHRNIHWFGTLTAPGRDDDPWDPENFPFSSICSARLQPNAAVI
jgi:hypothetical protein